MINWTERAENLGKTQVALLIGQIPSHTGKRAHCHNDCAIGENTNTWLSVLSRLEKLFFRTFNLVVISCTVEHITDSEKSKGPLDQLEG